MVTTVSLELHALELQMIDQALDNERIILEYGIEHGIDVGLAETHLRLLEPISTRIKAKIVEVEASNNES